MFRYRTISATIAYALLLFAGTPLAPDPRAGLLKAIDVPGALLASIDTSARDDLMRAVHASIEFYTTRARENEKFYYPHREYSREEMIISMELFLDTIRLDDSEERRRLLSERFLFFESIRPNGALFTGYYVPFIVARDSRSAEFSEALYGRPSDLVDVDLALFDSDWAGQRLSGRLIERRLEPYDPHAEIRNGSVHDDAEVIAYLNAADFYFMQVQGSAVLAFPDGSKQAVGYAGDNGRAFSSIFSHLKERVTFSRDALREHFRKNPNERRVLESNQRYIFFRREDAAAGHLHQPLIPLRSIATDARLPAGSLCIIKTDGRERLERIALIHDRGSAITGPGRVDVFFGASREAEARASNFREHGRLLLFVARPEELENDRD